MLFVLLPYLSVTLVIFDILQVFLFDIDQMKMTNWSKEAAENGLPAQWQNHPTKVIRILFDRNDPNTMLLHSSDMITLIDIAKVSWERFAPRHSSFPAQRCS